ncbi:hypothetical protein [Cellulomonas taurus]|uniref:hypothetical protein n=1 Tax=Cellulomonas taurus TaxID=2729175 RepID=UPI00145D468B|nr:hypothetical protein [Cellulomonas taurus]
MRSHIRWSSLAVVVGAGLLTLVCLGAALRGRSLAWLGAVICAAVLVRELRALRRLDRNG